MPDLPGGCAERAAPAPRRRHLTRMPHETRHETRKRVLIIGGGFGGVYAAVELDRLLKRDPTVEVTIVNRDNFFLFTPMLHEVAASDLDITHIVNPVRKLVRKVGFFDGDVVDIDLEGRAVVVAHGADDHTH